MSIEQRKGRLYLYGARRVHGRVVKEYRGPLSAEEAAYFRGRADDTRAMREHDRREAWATVARADSVLATGAEFGRLADKVFRVVMILTGHRLHRRGEWRRTRGVAPMLNLADLIAERGVPRPALISPVSADPAVQKVLDRAAAGDKTCLPEVVELLKDPRFVQRWGSVGGWAQASLISWAAGDDIGVSEALWEKSKQFLDSLLDGPTPSYPEKLLATRVMLNWLTLHILETLTSRYPPAGATAAALDNRVSQADRRLNASLKALETIRRLRRPSAPPQVNVSAGPMLVQNGAPASQVVGPKGLVGPG